MTAKYGMQFVELSEEKFPIKCDFQFINAMDIGVGIVAFPIDIQTQRSITLFLYQKAEKAPTIICKLFVIGAMLKKAIASTQNINIYNWFYITITQPRKTDALMCVRFAIFGSAIYVYYLNYRSAFPAVCFRLIVEITLKANDIM